MIRFVLFFALLSFNGLGQDIKIFSDRCIDEGYRFLYYLPDDSLMLNNPSVLVFLHGKSLAGTNLNLVKKYGVIDAIERGRVVPSIVIAPQVEKGHFWNPQKILNTMNYLYDKHPFDTNRVYVTGMSLGGYGTADFAATFPDKLTAGVVLCGGRTTGDICNLSRTNIWIQHGVLDKLVPHYNSEKMFKQVISCDSNSNCFFTSYPNANHSDLAHEFYKDTIYNWMFQFDKRIDKKTEECNEIETLNYAHAKIGAKLPNVNHISSSNQSINNRFHKVSEGDSLHKISRIYGVSIHQLKKLNKLDSDIIYPGQVLILNNE